MILIKCQGSSLAKLEELYLMQGDLKELPYSAYEKLKANIMDRGIIAPFFIWSKINGKPKKKEIQDGKSIVDKQ